MSTVISVSGLRKSYGSTHAVDGLDLTIEQGEIFALLGPNGAGKTTTVEILEGFRDRDGGEVKVLGFDPATKGRTGQIWRDRIGIVLQSTADAGDLTVYESVSHFATYYENPKDPREVIELVGLSEKSDALGRTLSGGQRRRLDVALGIIGSPELIFLDEATSGLDAEGFQALDQLLRSAKAKGCTLVAASHLPADWTGRADRLAVVLDGRIAAIGQPDELLAGRDLLRLYGELAANHSNNTQVPSA